MEETKESHWESWIEKNITNSESSWEVWIEKNTIDSEDTPYDKVAEIAVYSYNLALRSRKEDMIDKRHCFLIWWSLNRDMFQKYSTLKKISSLLKIHHSTTLHYINTRKKTSSFKENVSCLLDTLTS